jgi:hypothetical protein
MDGEPYDWIDVSGRYRHFHFDKHCENKPELVLALVEECLNQLGDIAGYSVLVRYPLRIERDTTWESPVKHDIAHVRYRLAIDLHSRSPIEYGENKYFGLAKDGA